MDGWMKTPKGLIRGRGLGLPFGGKPGAFNAITDVGEVAVGYTTLISGSGPLEQGTGPVRTGVTAILPRGRSGADTPCAAGTFTLNGSGELTGLSWIEESGCCDGPVAITNTHSLGLVRDAIVKWSVRSGLTTVEPWACPSWARPMMENSTISMASM